MIKPARAILSVFVAFLYSLAYTILGPMTVSQDFTFKKSYILSFAICFVVCIVANYLLFTFVPRIRLTKVNAGLSKFFGRFKPRTLFLLTWLFIFLAWVPVFLITFPGVFSYDIISQTYSALTEITSNHHPVLHTWLLRVFMRLGEALFKDHPHERGLGFLSLLQMLLLSYALTRLCIMLKEKKAAPLAVLLSTLFSAFWFTNAVMTVTMVKDTLHGAFFVLFVCHFTEMVTAPGAYFSKVSNRVLFPIVGFFMFATRNNGLHIYLFCFAILVIIKIVPIIREKKLKACIVPALMVVIPVVLFKIYSGPVFALLNIEQGNMREAFSVPIQQLQRVDVLKYNELTPEQLAGIESFILDAHEWSGYERRRAYSPFVADPAKGWFYTEYYKEHTAEFWKLYFQLGRQFTKCYVESFLSGSVGFWYPGYLGFSQVMYDNYTPETYGSEVEPLYRVALLNWPALDNLYRKMCYDDSPRTTPVLRLFFAPGFSAWILLYLLIFSWKKKGYFTKVLPLYLPHIAQFGIMLLCPIASFRYSWPLYLVIPIIALTAAKETDRTGTDEQ